MKNVSFFAKNNKENWVSAVRHKNYPRSCPKSPTPLCHLKKTIQFFFLEGRRGVCASTHHVGGLDVIPGSPLFSFFFLQGVVLLPHMLQVWCLHSVFFSFFYFFFLFLFMFFSFKFNGKNPNFKRLWVEFCIEIVKCSRTQKMVEKS